MSFETLEIPVLVTRKTSRKRPKFITAHEDNQLYFPLKSKNSNYTEYLFYLLFCYSMVEQITVDLDIKSKHGKVLEMHLILELENLVNRI